MKKSLTPLLLFVSSFVFAQWQPFVFTNTIVEDLYVIEDTLYADVNGDIYFTGDNGVTWDSITSLNAISNYREIGDKRYYYKYTTVGSTNGIYRKDLSQTGTDYQLWAQGWATNFEISTDNKLVGRKGEDILISSDNGITVDTVYSFPEDSDADLEAVGPNDEFFVSLDDAPQDNGLLISTDLGQSFNNVLPVNSNFYLSDIDYNGNNYYGTFQSYLLKSADNGQNWTYTDIETQIANGFLAQILFLDNGNFIVGKQYTDVTPHVYLSTDNGASFTDFGQGLSGFIDCREMLIHGGYIYLATGQGLFRREYSGSVDISESAFEENINIFPNPSSGVFTISFSDATPTELTIFNVVGEKVFASSLNSVKAEINLSTQTAGIYFTELTSEKGIIRRAILIE